MNCSGTAVARLSYCKYLYLNNVLKYTFTEITSVGCHNNIPNENRKP